MNAIDRLRCARQAVVLAQGASLAGRETVPLADGMLVEVSSPWEATLAAWTRRISLPSDVYRALADSFRQFAFSTALDLRPTALADLKALIESGVRYGLSLKELLPKAEGVFARYGGVAGVPAHRLELVFRQNWINVINEGRYAFQFSPAGRNRAPLWEFQAIRDRRTDDVCMKLHGMRFDKTDAWGRQFLPPLHFNCRCVAKDVPLEAQVVARNGRAILASGIVPDEGFAYDKAFVPGFHIAA